MRLETAAVSRSYGARNALTEASFSMREGEIVAVLGPSGAGKSTLLRLLHLIEAPDSGRVLIDDEPAPTSAKARRALMRRIGLAQQRPGLLRATAVDNVAFSLRAHGIPRDQARVRARHALRALGLADRALADARDLSGGEAQRVALARATVHDPEALLLDEATNQLDPQSARLVEAHLRSQRARGAAIALVTHQVAQARRVADRFVLVERGRIVDEGDIAALDAPRTDALREFLAYA